ncbi:glyoxylase-like metal-dependent hydrolase (beta-lactamase superfamily II) [Prauserella shujinwangii]|uniref:Glyoxylase-like metal-dependent hydrolase (Beta-lactamase superfamily II) n=1 Tax=Prauserella shujinwangii TaxID=1453103 RepID=A0A2T0M1E9_9PSEU|nr:MBL fold metallo-hydrolase [Prauserella shujinwangii]PRX50397.1 glyoxylase-like metal-dependent hydrolase (beta-lactamase superfamily II) [Prauserella shujinwangii]
MDTVEVAPGLHQVRLGTSTHLLNAYLALEDDGVTVIDTGAVGSAADIRAALRRLGRAPGDVRRIVLTHFHADHAGSAAEIAGWADAVVVAGEADAPYVRGERPGPGPVFTEAERRLHEVVAAGLPPAPPCRVDQPVSEGDVLDFAGGAEVLSVPGHTPGSIALWLPRHRVLVTGDTVAESEGGLVLGPFNTDRELAWHSLRRLSAYDAEIACVGHGNPVLREAAAALRAATDPFG